MRKIIIGVMGPGEKASEQDNKNAFELGKLIAQENWVLLSGGRNSGVMDAVNKGAKSASGLTIGIMPDTDEAKISEAVDVPIITDMGSARNNINVLSSNVVVACGTIAPGTLSEIALALKGKKKVVLLNSDTDAQKFLQKIGGENVIFVPSPQEAINAIKEFMSKI